MAWALPWFALLAFLVFRVRLPREAPPGSPARPRAVTVVVPARDEAANIVACVASLTRSSYPDFDIVVVDDRSGDGTGDLVRAMDPGNARALRVLEGAELPDGWLGKPWACSQGAEVARGELLLFTDADTVHGPDLLGRAVAALEEDGADLLTLLGRQLMETFWERVVQPQVFFTLAVRFHDLDAALVAGRWRSVIANGQFMLFRRDAYDALGGHGAVRGAVAEDLAMAQAVVRSGGRLGVRRTEDAFSTRMYRSFAHLVEGWTKNMFTGGLATIPPRLRPVVPPAAVLSAAVLWLVPPAALSAALVGWGGAGLLAWSAAAVGASVALWSLFTARMGAPAAYGLLYPLGAAVGLGIFIRAWIRGTRVEWKGRQYVVEVPAEAP